MDLLLPTQEQVAVLTPVAGDPLAAVPVAMATAATLVRPSAWQWFVGGSVRNYSISPEGWRQLVDSQPRPGMGA